MSALIDLLVVFGVMAAGILGAIFILNPPTVVVNELIAVAMEVRRITANLTVPDKELSDIATICEKAVLRYYKVCSTISVLLITVTLGLITLIGSAIYCVDNDIRWFKDLAGPAAVLLITAGYIYAALKWWDINRHVRSVMREVSACSRKEVRDSLKGESLWSR